MEAEEERPQIRALDDVDRAVGEEIGRVALTLDAGLSLVQPRAPSARPREGPLLWVKYVIPPPRKPKNSSYPLFNGPNAGERGWKTPAARRPEISPEPSRANLSRA